MLQYTRLLVNCIVYANHEVLSMGLVPLCTKFDTSFDTTLIGVPLK